MVEFADLATNNPGHFNKSTNTLVLSKNATQGEVLRQTFLHELTHMAEKSDLYGELMDAMLTLKYGDDYTNSNQYKADFGSMRDLYARNGENLNDTEVNEELTAEAAWDILFPTLEDAQKLTEKNPGLVRRVLNWIEDMLNRVRGINDPEVDRLKQARDLYRKCLDEASQSALQSGIQNRFANDADLRYYDYGWLSDNGILTDTQAERIAGFDHYKDAALGTGVKPDAVGKYVAGYSAALDDSEKNIIYVAHLDAESEAPAIDAVYEMDPNGGYDAKMILEAVRNVQRRNSKRSIRNLERYAEKYNVRRIDRESIGRYTKFDGYVRGQNDSAFGEDSGNDFRRGAGRGNREDGRRYRFITPEQDAEYMNAVESGATETQQRMVDEVAKQIMAQSKIRDEEGKLLKVYHGTDTEFNTFDMSKGRANMDIQGSFFSPWDIDAGGYGPNVRAFYLDIKNPAPEAVAYRALHKYAGQNGAGIKARQDLIRVGYDGVNNGDEEYIAFFPGQIKSADITTYDDNGNVIPLSERFNEENNDIRYRLTDQSTLPSDEVLDRMLREWIAGREGNAVQASANAAPAMQAMKANIAVTQTSRQRRGRKPANIKSGDTIIREWRKAIGIDRNGNAYGKHPYLTAGKRKKRGATRAFLRQMYFRFPDWYRSFPGYGVITPE